MRQPWGLLILAGLAAAMLATSCAKPPKPAPGEMPKIQTPLSAGDAQKVLAAAPDKPAARPGGPRRIIVFTMSKGYRHSSIPLAAATIEILGQKTGAWQATVTDDPRMMAADKLKDFDAVVMDQCTGDLFQDKALKESLLGFVRGGKGIVGLHAATDCFDNWPEYGEMMGGYFHGHPFRKISVKLDDPASPVNAAFGGKGFEISDEIYTFREPYSRDRLHILLSIDWENSRLSKGNRDDNDYALSWIREYGSGRVFYCAFGHENEIWWDPAILRHYLAGIQYALGDLKADATPSAKLNIQPARGPVPGQAAARPK